MLFPQRREVTATGARENHWRRQWEQCKGSFYGLPDTTMDTLVNSYLQRRRAEEQANMMTTSTNTRPGCTDGAGSRIGADQAHKIHLMDCFPSENKYFRCESPKPDGGGPNALGLK
ncbi:hypothetical protein ACFX11_035636 [Malus domestica]